MLSRLAVMKNFSVSYIRELPFFANLSDSAKSSINEYPRKNASNGGEATLTSINCATKI